MCCGSAAVTERYDVTARRYQQFRCRTYERQFSERNGGVLDRTCLLPSNVIAVVVFRRLRYRLRPRDLGEAVQMDD